MKHSRPDYQARITDTAGIIPENEPVFLLRAQDRTAASVVRCWVGLNADHIPNDVKVATLYHATLMECWPVKKPATVQMKPEPVQAPPQDKDYVRDAAAGLGVLRDACHTNAVVKGFYDDKDVTQAQRIASLVANLHGEISELWEAFRKKKLGDLCDKGIPLNNMEEEMADIFIRLCDMAGFLKVDLGKAVITKIQYNASRPYRHGGKVA
jgi:NTP pyrophosphatase (non-canonical NTP hydrolase)